MAERKGAYSPFDMGIDPNDLTRFVAEQESGMTGEKYSPDMESEAAVYNPKYIESIKQRQQSAMPMTSQGMEEAGKMSKIGSMAATAGSIPSPASPYLLGAGLGLQAMGMIQSGKQAQRDAKYRAEVQKANARQEALNRLSQIGQSLKI